MSDTPAFWLDDDGSFWIDAPSNPDEREAGEELMAQAGHCIDEGGCLVSHGRHTVSLRDCPLDDCGGHTDPETGRELDCPEWARDVWEFESFEGGGLAWPEVEEAIAKGRVVILSPDLVLRGDEVHWRDDCECDRCDTFKLLDPANDAPSVPMFPPGTM